LVAHTVDIIDASFDKYFSTEYTLSILIGMDSFFYFIEDIHANALVLKHIPFDKDIDDALGGKDLALQKVLMTEKFLQLPYAKVNICYSSTKFTIVPEEIFNKHHLKSYLSQVTRVQDDQTISMCRLSKLDATIVYSVEKTVMDVAKSYFPGAMHLHIISPLIMQAHQYVRNHKGHQVFIHVGNGILGIVLFKGASLQLANTFCYETNQDFLYHTLLIYDQFKLNSETVPVILTGRVQKKSELYELLQTYIRNIQFKQSPSYYHYGPSFQDVNFHFYQDLLSIKLCV